MTTQTEMIAIDSLKTAGLQIRVELNADAIKEYAEAMREGATFPPIIVFRDPKTSMNYLADGFHRVEAVKENNGEVILAEVREGTFEDALKFALSTNDKHGVRRTNADKQRTMEIAWANRKRYFGDVFPSERQFASLCAVSKTNVHLFFDKSGVVKKATPMGMRSFEPENNEEATPSATTVTHQHYEERNVDIRTNLKDGKDRFGLVIPEKLIPAFESVLPRKLIRELKRTRKQIEDAFLRGEPSFAGVGQKVMINIDNAIADIKYAAPFCVCRSCRGIGCARCGNLGFQNILQYRNLPTEYKFTKGDAE